MPIYPFICECGKTKDVLKRMSEAPETWVCDCGKTMKRDWSAMGDFNSPMVEHVRYSWALGVNVDVPEDMIAARRRHPGANFDSLGRMEIKSRKEKLQRMKEAGLEEL